MSDTNVLGRRLLELRKKRGISQSELGQFLGVSATQIGDIEHGHSATTLQRLIQLCSYFDVSSDYLLGLSDDMRPRTPVQMSSAVPEIEPAPWMPLKEFQDFADTHDGSWELIEGAPVKMDSGSDAHSGCVHSLRPNLPCFLRGRPVFR